MADIVLDHLTVGYPHHPVLEDVSLSMAEGTLTCLLGPNGAGKSTLLRTISGFIPPLAGTLHIGGADAARLSPAQMSRLVSIVLTERPAAGGLTVGELVAMGRSPYTGFWGTLTAADRRIAGQAIEAVGIEHLAHRRIDTLSDGEMQKAMIAKSLAQRTPVMLLDEPTAFLDFTSKVMVMRLLRQLAAEQRYTVVVTTHDMELAAALAHQLAEIEQHRVVSVSAAQIRARIDSQLYPG